MWSHPLLLSTVGHPVLLHPGESPIICAENGLIIDYLKQTYFIYVHTCRKNPRTSGVHLPNRNDSDSYDQDGDFLGRCSNRICTHLPQRLHASGAGKPQILTTSAQCEPG